MLSRRRCCCGPSAPCTCSQCAPCPIPKTNLTCVLDGSTTTTLSYSSGANTWSDGVLTLSCTASVIALSGLPGGTWTRGATVCNPFSAPFTTSGHSVSIIGPSGCVCGICGTCCATCSPFNIPKADLTYTGPGGPQKLFWNGSTSWTTNCFESSPGKYTKIQLACVSGAYTIDITVYTDANCSVSILGRCDKTNLALTAVTYNPFNISYTSSAACYLHPISFTITCNEYGPATLCQRFLLQACSVFLCTMAIQIYNASGGTLLASGSTYVGGVVALIWAGSTLPYVVVNATCSSRYTTYSQTLPSMANGGSTTITLVPLSNYYCLPCRNGTPLSNTLILNDPQYGAVTLTYATSTADWTQPGWSGTKTVTCATGCGCPAKSVTIRYFWSMSSSGVTLCGLYLKYIGDGGTNCPNDAGVGGGFLLGVSMNPTVTPNWSDGAFFATFSWSSACAYLGKAYPVVGNFTLSE